MRTTKFLSILLVALLCCNACERDLGVQTLVGKIIVDANPCPPSIYSCLPGMMYWLETSSENYLIEHGIWADGSKIIFNDIEYFEGDEVEITGKVTFYKGYYSIEIISIKKLP